VETENQEIIDFQIAVLAVNNISRNQTGFGTAAA
jgi:hypothetical protein